MKGKEWYLGRRILKSPRPLILFMFFSAASVACGRGDETRITDVVTAPRPTAILIFPSNFTFDGAGESLQATARVQDQQGFMITWVPVYWDSSDDSVVTVTSSGLVTAVSSGQATITATAAQGNLKAVARVTVG